MVESANRFNVIDILYVCQPNLSTNHSPIVCPLIDTLTHWCAEFFQSFAFHVEVHPQFPDYTQCVTFGFYPSRYHELAHNLFTMTAIYVLPLIVIFVSYSLILVEISGKSRQTTGA